VVVADPPLPAMSFAETVKVYILAVVPVFVSEMLRLNEYAPFVAMEKVPVTTVVLLLSVRL